jgi:hypothetical protein
VPIDKSGKIRPSLQTAFIRLTTETEYVHTSTTLTDGRIIGITGGRYSNDPSTPYGDDATHIFQVTVDGQIEEPF